MSEDDFIIYSPDPYAPVLTENHGRAAGVGLVEEFCFVTDAPMLSFRSGTVNGSFESVHVFQAIRLKKALLIQGALQSNLEWSAKKMKLVEQIPAEKFVDKNLRSHPAGTLVLREVFDSTHGPLSNPLWYVLPPQYQEGQPMRRVEVAYDKQGRVVDVNKADMIDVRAPLDDALERFAHWDKTQARLHVEDIKLCCG